MRRQQKKALLRQLFGAIGGAAPGAFLVDEQGNLIEASEEDAVLHPVKELSLSGPGFAEDGAEVFCSGEDGPDTPEDP